MPDASKVNNAGCGRLSTSVASSSPDVATSSTLLHQDLRGLARSLSLARPVSRSKVHLTSAEVHGLPSCHLTPLWSLQVSRLPSSLHDQLSARSGRIVSRLACAMCWS